MFQLFKKFAKLFTSPKKGDPDYRSGDYGPTLKEQYAAQAAKQAKLEQTRREWLENVYPDIVKGIQGRSKANPPATD